MAYVQPDVATFKARYPEFVPVSDTLVGLVLSEAYSEVGETWEDIDRARAQMLLTAHKLAMEGEPRRTTTGASVGISGPLIRRRVGDVETEFAAPATSAAIGSAAWYQATGYGKQYYMLMRKNFPAVAAV